MMSRLLLLLPVLLLTGCVINVSANEDDEPDYLTSSSREDNGAPYSDAVRAGDTLYLSGKLGIDPQTGVLADGGIQAETLQALQNLSRTLDDFASDKGADWAGRPCQPCVRLAVFEYAALLALPIAVFLGGSLVV